MRSIFRRRIRGCGSATAAESRSGVPAVAAAPPHAQNPALAAVAALLLAACAPAELTPADTPVPSATPSPAATATSGPRESAFELVAARPELARFARAVRDADLATTLEGSGPFTLLAPTDAAFEALPEALRDEIFDPANHDLLRGVIGYHIAPGALDAATLAAMPDLQSAQGETVTISRTSALRLNAAQVTLADQRARNGVMHVVDAVLIPPSVQARYDAAISMAAAQARASVPNLLEVAVADGRVATFIDAMRVAGLLDGLRLGEYTVLAPSDLAFGRLPPQVREELLDAANLAQLRGLLANHLITGTVTSADLGAAPVLTNVQGLTLTVGAIDGDGAITPTIGGSLVLSATTARNGTLYVIDSVLVPPPLAPGAAAGGATP